jgi:hypothetical protein
MMNRRQILAGGLGVAAAPQTSAQSSKKNVAAVVTMYTNDGRLNTHANVIIGRLLDGYSPNGIFTEPRTRIVSMYTDQVPPADLSRGLAEKHGFRICPTIQEALTLGGADLAVDAVCFVGEHGQYPSNDRGQKLYPRYELMERIVEVFRRTGKVVPVFCDKHFSYSWLKAKAMYEWSRDLKFPLMAGSSIPLTVRTPEVEIPWGADLESALMLGYGDLDAYGFHTLESLQCMVERRNGGETGIRSLEWLEGPAVWNWRDGAGSWTVPLLDAAFARDPSRKPGRMEDNVKNPVAFLIEYKDGLRAVAYMINGQTSGWTFAAKVKGKAESLATHFGQPRDSGRARPLAHFDGLVHCMEEMFISGKPLYPVERTLLTTCALSILFESRAWKKRIQTPELTIAYRAPREAYFQRS